VALDLAGAVIGGGVVLVGHAPLRRPVIDGRIGMGSTRIPGAVAHLRRQAGRPRRDAS